jgi:hypothetical protein
VIIVGCKSSELKIWGLPSGINSKDFLPPLHDTSGAGADTGRRRGSHSDHLTSSDPYAIHNFRLVNTIYGHPSRVTNLCVYNPNTYFNEHGEEPIEAYEGGVEVREQDENGLQHLLTTDSVDGGGGGGGGGDITSGGGGGGGGDITSRGGGGGGGGEGDRSEKKKRRFSSGRVSHMDAGPVVVTVCRDLILRLWR